MLKRGKRCKKAQTAMEFLTTYGWVILVLGLVVTLLVSLKVFVPSAPNKCETKPPFACVDVIFREGGFEIILSAKNLLTGNIVSAKVNNELCTNILVVGNPIGDLSLGNKINKIRCYGDVNKVKEKDRVSADVTIDYVEELRGIQHKANVLAVGNVEPGYYNNFDASAILSMDFDNDNSTTVIDNSYYGHNGVLVGADGLGGLGRPQLTTSNCISNSCYYFGQILSYPSYINVGDTPTLQLQIPSFTIEYWINMRRLYSAGAVQLTGIISKLGCYDVGLPCNSYRGYTNTFNYTGDPEDHIFRFKINSYPSQYGDRADFRRNIVDGQWHHIVSVKEGSNLYIYFDGILVGSGMGATPSVGNPPPPLIIGEYRNPFGYGGFQGFMDNVRIYNRALPPAEIQRHYNQLKPPI